jgi:hypothetical protein
MFSLVCSRNLAKGKAARILSPVLTPMFLFVSYPCDKTSRFVIKGDSDLEVRPFTTNGDLPHQHSDLPLYSCSESGTSNTAPNDMPLSTTDFSMMDALWPVLPEPVYPFEFWDMSLNHVQSPLESLPPTLVSSDSAQLNSPELEPSGAPRKRRRRIPPDVKKMLNECFEQHKADPYVPQERLKELASASGLSLRQVRTFFANARARKLPPVPRSPKGQPKKSANRDIPGPGEEQQDPMQRFLSTSPEDEGISEEAIQKAANRINQTSSSAMVYRESQESDTISISDTTFSSNSGSGSSQASMDSANNRGPRRGRKRQREPTQKAVEEVIRKPSNARRKFQCTFCTSDFAQKFDWTRHETSVHFPQNQWICMPYGGTYDNDDGPHCVFCNELNPDDEHLETHNSNACSSTSLSSRTFLRKDKLVQHLTQVHRCCQFPKQIQAWCVPIERSATLVCGLCGLMLPDWHTRTAHISTHFQNGIGMDKWILKYPGGVIAHADSSDESTCSMYTIVVAPNGHFQCEVCPDRFNQLPHIIFHYRQSHGVYSDEDRVLMCVYTWPSDVLLTTSQKGHTDMAQYSSGMKLFKQRNPDHRKSISQIKRPIIPLVKKDGRGKGGVHQNSAVPIAPPPSMSDFAQVKTTIGIAPHVQQTSEPTLSEDHLAPLTCKFNGTHHLQLENVINSGDEPGINSRIPQGFMQSQRQASSASTLTTQSIPWPTYLHEMPRFPMPAKQPSTCSSRPKRATRLSNVSMAPPQSTLETGSETLMQNPQQDALSMESGHSSFLFMESVSDSIAAATVDGYAGGNSESAQYKCWDGQTRIPDGVADSAQYKCWDGQTRMPGGDL